MNIWFWFWVLSAAILLVAELLSRELLYAPFSAGAVAAGFMEWAAVPVGWQWLAFLGLSMSLSVLLRRRVLALWARSAEGVADALLCDRSPSDTVVEEDAGEANADRPARDDEAVAPTGADASPGADYRNVPRRSRRLHRRGR